MKLDEFTIIASPGVLVFRAQVAVYGRRHPRHQWLFARGSLAAMGSSAVVRAGLED